MLVDRLTILLEAQRTAEQMLHMLGSNDARTISSFERANELKAQLLAELRDIDDRRSS